MSDTLYPLRLTPVYKDYIWGGNRIARRYNRTGTPTVCAESWEVADRPEGESHVVNGPLAGTPLSRLTDQLGPRLTGRSAPPGPFPLLIKLIDATETLSVQVHPSDASADRLGGEPKTEMWYMLDTAPGAAVFAGLKPGTDEHALREAVRAKRLEDLLVRTPVKADEAVYIEGGCLHAIGAGCLLLEVQQNSNTTYRVYDWDRLGHDGKPRELHLEKAVAVTNFTSPPPAPRPPRHLAGNPPNERWEILCSPYFHMRRLELSVPETLTHDGRSFTVLFVRDGAATLGGNGVGIAIQEGNTCLLPAALEAVELRPQPTASVLAISLV